MSTAPSSSSMSASFFDAHRLRIAAVVTAYMIVSITLVFTNKALMPKRNAADERPTFPEAPLFVTWFQCVLSAAIIYALGRVSVGASADSWLKEFPQVDYTIDRAMNVMTLSLIFVGMITFNNLCLMYVSVPFYNVARSLTIVANVIFTYIFLGETTSLMTIACLAVVIVGFFLGIDGEINVSVIGTFYGLMSSCFVSLNAIFTRRAMPHVDNDKWKLQWYNNVNAMFLFMPLIYFSGEHHVLYEYLEVLSTPYYWTIMSVAGVLGFAIGIVTVMQINITSPLSHNISGTVKACLQTILAVFIWPNTTSAKGFVGIFTTIIGSLLYTAVRNNEMEAAKAAKAQPRNTIEEQPINQENSEDIANDDNGEIELGRTRQSAV